MNKCICDICKIDNPNHHFKIKERKLMTSCVSDLPIFSWEQIDICDKCFSNLVQLRYEKTLENRVEELCNHYTEKYPNDYDMQSAYLQGIEDSINILLPNKIKKTKR